MTCDVCSRDVSNHYRSGKGAFCPLCWEDKLRREARDSLDRSDHEIALRCERGCIADYIHGYGSVFPIKG